MNKKLNFVHLKKPTHLSFAEKPKRNDKRMRNGGAMTLILPFFIFHSLIGSHMAWEFRYIDKVQL